MREILFKGKRVDNGEWIEGIAFPHDIHGAVTMFRQHPADGSLIGNEVIPETVGQYTGLTDKNSTKIFEGDIIRDVITGDIFKIIYCGYAFIRVNKKHFYLGLDVTCEDYEVIGNIVDNLEEWK